MNSLIPFNFEGFRTNEAFFGNGIRDAVKRFRFTRRGIVELFGASDPQKAIDNLISRHPELSRGIPLTVRGMNGREYQTETYHILDAYQFALESDLPGAKAFLRKFPDFLLALQSGQIRPALKSDRRLLLINEAMPRIAATPPYQRGKLINAFAREMGCSKSIVYVWLKQFQEKGAVSYGFKAAQARLREKRRPIWQRIRELAGEGKSMKEIASRAGVSVATVRRVLKRVA